MDVRKGLWTEEEEDLKLKSYVNVHGEGRLNSVALLSGLKSSLNVTFTSHSKQLREAMRSVWIPHPAPPRFNPPPPLAWIVSTALAKSAMQIQQSDHSMLTRASYPGYQACKIVTIH
ncbi:hypothetical protein V6N13_140271 [Hibiscus sabdariffa]|uniref:Uncharacterized protein n=2 Tax=Hibiscus sabdariffa TaxID=183260 RepID=A0ABR1ZQB0_9ROSI